VRERTPCCPPENCGGPWDFDELMRILGDEVHPEHEMYRQWMGSIGGVDYDPARFELNEINTVLASHAGSVRQGRQ